MLVYYVKLEDQLLMRFAFDIQTTVPETWFIMPYHHILEMAVESLLLYSDLAALRLLALLHTKFSVRAYYRVASVLNRF